MPTCSSSFSKSSQNLKRPESRNHKAWGESPRSSVNKQEVHMSDEELEVMVTLDDPWYGPDEDIFHERQEDHGNEVLFAFN